MSAAFFITLPFFALVICGYGAARMDFFGAVEVRGLNRFVYFFALPALLFRQIAIAPLDQIISDQWFLFGYMCAGLIVFSLAWILVRALFKSTPGEASVLSLGASYGNIGFMGIPLIVTVLGEAMALPLALMLLIDVAFFIPLATTIIDMNRPGGEPTHLGKALFTSIFKNPLIIAIILGFLFTLAGIGLPVVLDRFANLLGQAAAPAAMFALGAVLAGRPVAERFGEVSFVCVLKLTVHPLVTWWVMTAFAVSPEWRLAATLGTATPVAAALFVIAQEYNTLPARASTVVLVSTAASLVTLTTLISWLG